MISSFDGDTKFIKMADLLQKQTAVVYRHGCFKRFISSLNSSLQNIYGNRVSFQYPYNNFPR